MAFLDRFFRRRKNTKTSASNSPTPIPYPGTLHAERIGQININPGVVSQSISLPEPSLPPASVPYPKDFIGRVQELEMLLDEHGAGKRTFVLNGIGGVGKTELARKFAEILSAQYVASIEVQMQGMTTPIDASDAMRTVARAFNPKIQSPLNDAEIRTSFLTSLNAHPTILILDDIADLAHLGQLHEANCCLIITSRQRICLDGEPFIVGRLNNEEAKALLADNGGGARFGEFLSETAQLCDNLPLALKLVRGLLLNSRLINVAEFLVEFRQARLIHLNEVSSSFSLSYEKLGSKMQRFWRSLSVFPGGFEAYAAAAVWDVDKVKAIEILQEFDARSLINLTIYSDSRTVLKDKNPTFPYFGLHDLAKEFAAAKLLSDEKTADEYRHAKHYAIVIAGAKGRLENGLVFFDLEQQNIEIGFKRAAARFCDEDAYAELCLIYTGTFNDVLPLRLHPRRLLAWQEIGIEAARKLGATYQEMLRLGNKGTSLQRLGQYDEAIECLLIVLEYYSSVGDKEGVRNSLTSLGVCYDFKHEFGDAIENYTGALKIAEELGDLASQCGILTNLGVPLYRSHRYEEAKDVLERARSLLQDDPHRFNEGIILSGLANVFEGMGNPKRAFILANEALEISREYGDRLGEGVRLGNIGNLNLRNGDLKTAREYWQQAVTTLDSIESPQAETFREILRRSTISGVG